LDAGAARVFQADQYSLEIGSVIEEMSGCRSESKRNEGEGSWYSFTRNSFEGKRKSPPPRLKERHLQKCYFEE
jgi:hypothetical protein